MRYTTFFGNTSSFWMWIFVFRILKKNWPDFQGNMPHHMAHYSLQLRGGMRLDALPYEN